MTIPPGDRTPTGALVLREADEGRWPDRELTALVDYLHLEVLRQIVRAPMRSQLRKLLVAHCLILLRLVG